MALEDLEAKYFDVQNPGDAPEDQIPPVYRGTTVVRPIIDGANYFPKIHAAISGTAGADDAVYIVGWRMNPQMDLLDGTIAPLDSASSIGNLLAVKAAQGVDVRLVLNGTLALYWVPVPWAESLHNAEALRALVPTGSGAPPLAQRILFDWSGANQTGSQHQKAVVVRRGTEVTAFVGGMDFNPNIFDIAPHDEKPIPNSEGGGSWGWHDFGVQLEGEAAKRVLHNFRCRWHEASTLPEKLYKWQPGDDTEDPRPFNPAPILPAPDVVPLDPAAPDGNSQSVQVLRSRFKWKIPNRCGSGGTAWAGLPDEPATGGFLEVYNTMKKAIAAATRYIYVEDQFLMDSPPGGYVGDFAPLGGNVPILLDGMDGLKYSLYAELLNALSAPNAFNLRLIFVGSGRKDPEDPGTTLRNQTITPSVRRIIDGLPANRKGNVAVWRRDKKTVHSKLMIIDDEFMSVGSANFQSRSMAGVDNEIHVAIVADDDLIKDNRKALWKEHFDLGQFDGVAGVESGLDNIDIALGLWGDDWYVPDQTYWADRTGYNMVNGFGGLSPVLP